MQLCFLLGTNDMVAYYSFYLYRKKIRELKPILQTATTMIDKNKKEEDHHDSTLPFFQKKEKKKESTD